MDTRIRRRLRLRDLDTLIAVAETGSMARAAARLAVSQPAVSKAIAEMERTLGYRLLDRTVRGVEPNLYGRALLKWAKAVFDDVHQGVAELDFISDPTSGELRVAATGPIVAAILRSSSIACADASAASYFTSTRSPRFRSSRTRWGAPGRSVMSRTLADDEDFGEEILFHERTFVAANSSNPLCRRRNLRWRSVDEPWCPPPSDTSAAR